MSRRSFKMSEGEPSGFILAPKTMAVSVLGISAVLM